MGWVWKGTFITSRQCNATFWYPQTMCQLTWQTKDLSEHIGSKKTITLMPSIVLMWHGLK